MVKGSLPHFESATLKCLAWWIERAAVIFMINWQFGWLLHLVLVCWSVSGPVFGITVNYVNTNNIEQRYTRFKFQPSWVLQLFHILLSTWYCSYVQYQVLKSLEIQDGESAAPVQLDGTPSWIALCFVGLKDPTGWAYCLHTWVFEQ